MKSIIKKLSAFALCLAMLGMTACDTTATASSSEQESSVAESSAAPEESSSEAETTASSESEAAPAEQINVRIATLKGPTGMGMAKLMDDSANSLTTNKYEFTIASAPDEVTAAVVAGNVDIAAVPSNLAAALYKKTNGGVQVAAINTLGVLYVLENGNTINSIADLKGKTIVASGQAATPEYAIRYILEKNGIDPDKDVTIEYKAEHSELATLMTSGDVTIGLLPEPNVTAVLSGNKDVRIALNLTDEWNKVADDGSALIMGCVIVNKDFAEKNKAAVDAFLDEYKASVEYANADNQAAAQLIEKYGIVPKAAVAMKALPNCNIVYIDGDEMKTKLTGFFNVLFEANPKSVGGAVPDDNIFYKK